MQRMTFTRCWTLPQRQTNTGSTSRVHRALCVRSALNPRWAVSYFVRRRFSSYMKIRAAAWTLNQRWRRRHSVVAALCFSRLVECYYRWRDRRSQMHKDLFWEGLTNGAGGKWQTKYRAAGTPLFSADSKSCEWATFRQVWGWRGGLDLLIPARA